MKFLQALEPKNAFISIANSSGGLDPIDYINAQDGVFETIYALNSSGNIAQYYSIWSQGIYTNILKANDIEANVLKWISNPNYVAENHFVAFKAGSLTQDTIWTLPLKDGDDGQVITTNGKGILSFGDGGSWAPADATYIIQKPHEKLPNAQALSKLLPGIMFNNDGGIVSTSKRIALENLPELGATWIIDPFSLKPPEFIGYIYEGTESTIPKTSATLAEMFTDLLLVNGRFLTATFIMGKGSSLVKTLMPFSQFLEDLNRNGILACDTTGKISIASPELTTQNAIITWGNQAGNNMQNTPVTITVDDDVARMQAQVGTNLFITGTQVKATQSLLSDGSAVILGQASIGKGDVANLFLNDTTPAKNYVGLTVPNIVPANIVFTLPILDGQAGQVLSTNGQGVLSFINNGEGKAPSNAKYILQEPFNGLPNAQSLNTLGLGLLKCNLNGVVAIAILNTDYPSVASVTAAQNTANTALETATAAAEAAAAAAGVAAQAQTIATGTATALGAFQVVVTGEFLTLGMQIASKASISDVRSEVKLNQLGCTANVSLQNHKLTNVSNPQDSSDGANKGYVDGQISSIKGYVDGQISSIIERIPVIIKGSAQLPGNISPNKVTVQQSRVTENSTIIVTPVTNNLNIIGSLAVTRIIPNTSFDIYSSYSADTSIVNWIIII